MFRLGRSTHQALRHAKKYIEECCEWVVDIDLEKCFDRINHDILMVRIAKRIFYKRILLLIRLYIQAGIMVNGVVRSAMGKPREGAFVALAQ